MRSPRVPPNHRVRWRCGNNAMLKRSRTALWMNATARRIGPCRLVISCGWQKTWHMVFIRILHCVRIMINSTIASSMGAFTIGKRRWSLARSAGICLIQRNGRNCLKRLVNARRLRKFSGQRLTGSLKKMVRMILVSRLSLLALGVVPARIPVLVMLRPFGPMINGSTKKIGLYRYGCIVMMTLRT